MLTNYKIIYKNVELFTLSPTDNSVLLATAGKLLVSDIMVVAEDGRLLPTVTLPTAKTSLTYTKSGSSATQLSLINAGSTTGGTLLYALGSSTTSGPASTATWYQNASDIKGANAESYYIWYRVLENDDYKGIPATYGCTSSIAVRSLTIPTLSNTSKTYNGSSLGPTVNNYNSIYETLGGTATSTNVGTGSFTITWSLQDTTNTKWSDGTISDKSGAWTMSKAANPMTVTATQSKSVVRTSSSFTFTGAANAQGAVTYAITSGGSSYFTISGTTISIKNSPSAGSYTIKVSATAAGNENYNPSEALTITISLTLTNNQAAVTTAPVGNTGLTYTRSAQLIIKTAGTASNGTMQYQISTSTTTPTGTWYTTITDSNLKKTDAGTYYIHYYAKGNTGYDDSEKSYVATAVTISLKQVSLTWGTASWTYDGSAHSTTCTAGSLVSGDTCTVTLSGNSITNAGTATVTATDLSNSNYKLPTTGLTKTLTINKANIDLTKVTKPTINTGLLYTGSNLQIFSTLGSATGQGTINIAIGTSSTTAPTTGWVSSITSTSVMKSAVGTYHCWYKVVGDSNHNDSAGQYINTSTITECLTFTAKASTNIGFYHTGYYQESSPSIQYSKNNGTWTNYTIGTNISLTNGLTCKFKGTNTEFSIYYDDYINFRSTGSGTISGNVMTLLDPTGLSKAIHSEGLCFYGLFENCTWLTSIPSGLLPATTLAEYCYKYMFNGCTGLTSIPSGLLPATTLAEYCYEHMFHGCTSLTSIPSGLLPTTTLAEYCYSNMFTGCTGLTSIPSNLLPATTLDRLCYSGMFSGCTGLTSIPSGFLPTTKLTSECYAYMFSGCTSLTSIPSNLLPATTLANYCYYGMFYGCSSLQVHTSKTKDTQVAFRIPTSGTGTTASGALLEMFGNTGGTFTGTPSINTTYYIGEAAVDYLTFTAKASTTVKLNKSGSPSSISLLYSTNNGSTWTNYTIGTAISLSTNNTLKWKASSTNSSFSTSSSKYYYFSSTGNYEVSGNIMTLLDSTGSSKIIPCNYCFYGLFYNSTTLKSISSLSLPATTLTENCYYSMFWGCTGLTSIPSGLLPATTLAIDCYADMFRNCTGLTSIPSGLLPATTLANYCYLDMFWGCTGLTSIPSNLLPATTLSNFCYAYMFRDCTGLTSIPSGFLPATTLANYCYSGMFSECTGLTSIPSGLLPATTLAEYCYGYMFFGCSSLQVHTTKTKDTQIAFRMPATGTGTTASGAFYLMFAGTGGTFTDIPSINTTYYIGEAAVDYLTFTAKASTNIGFYHAGAYLESSPSIQYSKNNGTWTSYTIGTNISLTNGLTCQFRGTNTEFSIFYLDYINFRSTGSGTISGNVMTLLDPTGLSKAIHSEDDCFFGLFENCTWLTTIPSGLLPATTLAEDCYSYMFRGCTGLTSIPSNLLPATTLAEYCYSSMFNGCTGLTSIPSNLLPATTLAKKCYSYMFRGCTGLTLIPSNLLPATTLAGDCYSYMFRGCTGLTLIPSNLLPATTLAEYCYSSMFRDCTGLTSIPSNLLPATTLAERCYSYMFYGCTGLTSIPSNLLPATTLAGDCYSYMFNGCSSLQVHTTKTKDTQIAFRIPTSGTGTIASYALNSMFTGTGGTFTDTPSINTTYYIGEAAITSATLDKFTVPTTATSFTIKG